MVHANFTSAPRKKEKAAYFPKYCHKYGCYINDLQMVILSGVIENFDYQYTFSSISLWLLTFNFFKKPSNQRN